MTSQEQFFYEHAGYSYGQGETLEQGRQRSAVKFARAEQYAQKAGWTYEWEYDPDADLSFMSEEERAQEHECLACVLKDADGAVLASLCGIIDADRDYGRVIEAELALEALSDIEREQKNVAECERLMVL